jgi:hypothetical protein
LPGCPLHLWGVKLTLRQHATRLPANVVSIASAAWNGRFGTWIEASGSANKRWVKHGTRLEGYAMRSGLNERTERGPHAPYSYPGLSR